MGDKTPPPDCDREYDDDSRKPEYLHQKIGEDCPRPAEKIARAAVRRIIETWIERGPSRERKHANRRRDHEREPTELGKAPAQCAQIPSYIELRLEALRMRRLSGAALSITDVEGAPFCAIACRH